MDLKSFLVTILIDFGKDFFMDFEADLDAIWRRKRSNVAFSQIWNCFGRILEAFYTYSGWILCDCSFFLSEA